MIEPEYAALEATMEAAARPPAPPQPPAGFRQAQAARLHAIRQQQPQEPRR